MAKCSPHARGWSPAVVLRVQRPGVLPARAGMVPGRPATKAPWPSAPRTRGDGPRSIDASGDEVGCSPHARGWSPSLSPQPSSRRVLPARAGMVPAAPERRRRQAGAPRTRGDGPTAEEAPDERHACSPHARGWSPAKFRPATNLPVLPARAGMVPTARRRRTRPGRAPRPRGDGPWPTPASSAATACSPRAGTFPPHAMEPRAIPKTSTPWPLRRPRARRPHNRTPIPHPLHSSPRVRAHRHPFRYSGPAAVAIIRTRSSKSLK
nr:hypothetical protein [Streptomyces tsukubensis NRRL18488]